MNGEMSKIVFIWPHLNECQSRGLKDPNEDYVYEENQPHLMQFDMRNEIFLYKSLQILAI